MDRTFAALADPTRRALLERLSEQPGLTVTELAAPLPLSLPAVMKHLDVLSAAGLITRAKEGRSVSCRVRPDALREARAWMERQGQFWTQSLDRLAEFLEKDG